MKVLFFFSFLSFLMFKSYSKELKLTSFEAKPSRISTVKRLVNKISKKDLLMEMRSIIKASGKSRAVTTPGHLNAKNYLIDRIKELDSTSSGILVENQFDVNSEELQKEYDSFFSSKIEGNFKSNDPEYIKWKRYIDQRKGLALKLKGQKGTNIIWEKKGKEYPGEVLILGVNIDTLILDSESLLIDLDARSPGADRNATGMAVALKVIQLASALEIPRTVRVVFYDYHEWNAHGAKNYINRYKETLKTENVHAHLFLTMLGFDTKRSDKDKKLKNFAIYRKNDRPSEKDMAKRLKFFFSKTAGSLKFIEEDHEIENVDNLYRDLGLSSLVLSSNRLRDPNPGVNTPNDLVESLNFNTYHLSMKVIVGAVISWTYDLKR